MPGIFGLIPPPGSDHGESVGARLADDMVIFPWQSSARIEGPAGGPLLGVAVNGQGADARAPFLSEEGGVSCVFEGILTRCREDSPAGPLIADGLFAAAAISAYRRFGDAFASRLEGRFNLILHDRKAGRVVIANDRNGLCPLYHFADGQSQLFCSLLGPMAACGLFKAEFEPLAVTTLLAHAHLFADQGLLRGVTLMNAASTITIDTAGNDTKHRQYWHYGFEGQRDPDRSFSAGIDELCDVLTAAAERDGGRPGKAFTGLSGGMDSRLVTGLALRSRPDLQAWTFGREGASDLAIATEICRLTGMEHHVFHTSPECIADYGDDFVSATNCSAMINHAFSFERAHALRGKADFIHNGYRGGVLLGNAIVDLGFKSIADHYRARLLGRPTGPPPRLEDCADDEQLMDYYAGICHHPSAQMRSILVHHLPDMRELMTPVLARQLAPVPLDYRLEQWTEEYGGGRHMTLAGIVGDRHFHGDASLFYDYDVRDLCLALAPSHRRDRRAYIAVLKRLLPDLARLDYANTMLPADTPGWRVTATRIARRLTRRRVALSTGVNTSETASLPALREFYGDLIHSASARNRDCWRGERLVELFDDHHAKKLNAADEIHAAVTVELFARRWMDAPTGGGR